MFSKNMKVLYPILHYPPVIGGLEQWSQNIAERQPQDTEVCIVTGRVRGEARYEKKNNVTIFRTSLFELKDLSHSSLVYIAGAVPFITFWSLFRARKVDLIHCHGFISALMGYFLALFTEKPFVGTEQSVIWSNAFSKFISGVVYRKACLCIASSRAVAEGFKEIRVKKVEIVPNGV
ncbi:MAG: glycosyltransferase, partial [Candidatus Spechtbacterales bacterium]